jgi:hypothetical protein
MGNLTIEERRPRRLGRVGAVVATLAALSGLITEYIFVNGW